MLLKANSLVLLSIGDFVCEPSLGDSRTFNKLLRALGDRIHMMSTRDLTESAGFKTLSGRLGMSMLIAMSDPIFVPNSCYI
jgi:hypothetical protein